MGEFSVNTDKMNSLADILEKQANELEKAGSSIDTVKGKLKIHGAARASVMTALNTTGAMAKKESQTAVKMGKVLREISAAYRSAENRITGQAGGGNGSFGGGAGGGGFRNGSEGQNGNNKNSGVYSSDPVNLNTGNFILDNHDMEISGSMPLIMGRFYNSMGTFFGMLGADWHTGFELKLFRSPEHELFGNDICIMLGDGREEYFASPDGSRYIAVSESTAELIKNEEGYLYQTLEGKQYLFDQSGCYIRFEDAHHVGYDLIYEAGKLAQVKKDSGEFFTFSYNENGMLDTVTDHTGRACRYLYEEKRLRTALLPDGSSYEYRYNGSGKLCHVTNPRSVDAVETEYDGRYRVISQKFADGTTNMFEYRDAEMAVVMTERNGSQSIHYHNEKYQNIRNVYPDGEESFDYNERGQKIRITDKLGNITRIQYDNRGNITGILTPDRNKTAITYNQQNRLLTLSVNGKTKVRNQYGKFGDLLVSEDGIGRKTSYSYDKFGRIIQVGSPDGSALRVDYDIHGNVIGVTDDKERSWKFFYDERNQMIGQENPLGHHNTVSYDEMGRIISQTRPDGSSRFFGYDKWGNLISQREYDGSTMTAAYNANNKPVSVKDSAGRETFYDYDSMWNVSRITLPGGAVLQYLYDENNYLKSTLDELGSETSYTYDAMGNIRTSTDAEGNCTEYTWDTNGRCIMITDPEGYVTEFRYGDNGEIIYVKDAEGGELFRSFDDADQLVYEKDSIGRSRSYTYNLTGDVVSVTDESGCSTSFEYEKGTHNLRTVLYPDESTERYTYDELGRVIFYTDRYGKKLFYSYDILGRLTALTNEKEQQMEYAYDLMGRILREKDFDGHVTTYAYDTAGQLSSITDALGNTTSYKYDALDNLTEVLRKNPAASQAVHLSYEYNKAGQLEKLTDAPGRTETYKYDRLGRMIGKTDREGLTTSYTYDARGMLQGVKWADGKETAYTYTPLCRLNKVEDWTGITRMQYDRDGQLARILYPDDRVLAHTYDIRGNRIHTLYPDGQEIFYEYDGLNRLTRLTQGQNSIHYNYDNLGNLIGRELPGEISVGYEYDKCGKISRIICKDAEGVLDEMRFGYDAYGRRDFYKRYRRDDVRNTVSYRYSYDAAGHLQQVFCDDQLLREYSYDAFGNRSSLRETGAGSGMQKLTSYSYDLSGALLRQACGDDVIDYRYDPRGNLIQQIQNGRVVKNYTYDASNRLMTAEKVGGVQASYSYNGLGYRTGMSFCRDGKVKKVSYTLDYSRIYDNLLEKHTDQNTETYLWGDGLEGVQAESGSSGWYLKDPLGSVVRKLPAVSQAGKMRLGSVAEYDEFGNIIIAQGTEEDSFGYNGFLFDSVADTWYAQARQYRSETGSFDGMDRFGGDITAPETLNPYVYCVQSPFRYTDKSGYYFGFDDAIAAFIGAVGGGSGQLIGDLITSAKNGQWTFSSWQSYTGAMIGGAAGGVTTLYAGPIAGGAVSGGVATLTTEGLTWASDPNGYNKTFAQVAGETAIDAGMGALSGVVSKYVGKGIQKIMKTKAVQSLISKMSKGGKFLNYLAGKMGDIAKGKSSKWWSTMSKYLKNQHEFIGNSTALKRKLLNVLLHALPVYLAQEIWGNIVSKAKPSKFIWSKIKKWMSGKLKDFWKGFLDLWNGEKQCAAAS